MDWRRIYRAADWLMIALALQGLWILGTLAGLVVLGYGPASTALAACWRSMVHESTESSVQEGCWRLFWRTWRRELGRSQGVVLVPTLTLWPIVFWALRTRSLPVAVVVLAIGCGLLLTLVYFPVAAAAGSGRGVVESWRLGVALAWTRPGPTMGIGLGVVALAVVSVTVSSIVWPLFVPSLPVLAAVWSSERTLGRRQAVELDPPA
ncbi:DUF624 domain-containing protein [Dactylosporangium sp. CA-233914]|uniref:DUF624 domain-containing protein n=1 Tax=Dactylosporangium sp. CA-233914 TaxID=3239934 RepID=UPI003D94A8DD